MAVAVVAICLLTGCATTQIPSARSATVAGLMKYYRCLLKSGAVDRPKASGACVTAAIVATSEFEAHRACTKNSDCSAVRFYAFLGVPFRAVSDQYWKTAKAEAVRWAVEAKCGSSYAVYPPIPPVACLQGVCVLDASATRTLSNPGGCRTDE